MFLVLDQSQLNYNELAEVTGNVYQVQTFKAGLTGFLPEIKLNLYEFNNPTDNLVIEIRDVVDSKPGSTIHASTEITPGTLGEIEGVEFNVIFSIPYSVTSGTSYAIVLRVKNNGASEYYLSLMGIGNYYVDGGAFYSTNGGSTWNAYNPAGHDLYFKTYVNVPRTSSPFPMFFKS